MRIQIQAIITTPNFIIEAQFDGTFKVRGRGEHGQYCSGDFSCVETAMYAVQEAENLIQDVEINLEETLREHDRAIALLN